MDKSVFLFLERIYWIEILFGILIEILCDDWSSLNWIVEIYWIIEKRFGLSDQSAKEKKPDW